MTTTSPKIQYLKDYQPCPFELDGVFLHFDLHEDKTSVKTIINFKRKKGEEGQPLVLNGEDMQLKRILINGTELKSAQYQVDDHSLTLLNPPDVFTLETEVEIKPQENTRLAGLYKSNSNFCTQCESHGFRRITYFLDRPDVLTHFTTTIAADKQRYPVLLSNGNLTAQEDLSEGRHWVKWEDPTRKPCYLFALVAGNLEAVKDQFTTQSGRPIQLELYVEPGKTAEATYAMQSLKAAMRWDEEAYGREYDLDMYLIVAVNDFNFGAMENKGLNIFNEKYILAKPETATDEDYVHVQGVIAHEYFHNWSGNRVTVRDWFQITLKEGLTVFREHQFTADKTSKVVKRIEEAKTIRNAQFVQDAGPMAHPIYPDSYIEVNNFYTVTVYEKGAEVIRMFHTLLGPALFRKAMDLYFSRNDGFPVTVEEFVKAMEDGSGMDLTQFRRWYKQAGTPILNVTENYDAANKTYTLTVAQSCPPTPEQPQKEPFHIPFALGLLDQNGRDLPLQLKDEETASAKTTRVFSLKKAVETLQFINIAAKPTPSLLRDFSAPVKLQYDYSKESLIFLMAHDSDDFNRWDAGQKLAMQILLQMVADYQQHKDFSVPPAFLDALTSVFKDSLDDALKAEMLTLPSETYIGEQMDVVDVDAIHAARDWLKKRIAVQLEREFSDYYQQHSGTKTYELTAQAMGTRRLKNLTLQYLALLEKPTYYAQCLAQFKNSNNMTDTMGAVGALISLPSAERDEMLNAFYQRWENDPLVVDKWFMLQAYSVVPDALAVVKKLTKHPAFSLKNPNRARALIGAFCAGNPVNFHVKTGEGYAFLTDHVLQVNAFNPQLASRLVEPLIHWKKYDADRQALMKAELQKIMQTPKLSNDVYELVSKSLG